MGLVSLQEVEETPDLLICHVKVLQEGSQEEGPALLPLALGLPSLQNCEKKSCSSHPVYPVYCILL